MPSQCVFVWYLCIFQGGPYYNLLHSLLGAYACYRPDVGYVSNKQSSLVFFKFEKNRNVISYSCENGIQQDARTIAPGRKANTPGFLHTLALYHLYNKHNKFIITEFVILYFSEMFYCEMPILKVNIQMTGTIHPAFVIPN